MFPLWDMCCLLYGGWGGGGGGLWQIGQIYMVISVYTVASYSWGQGFKSKCFFFSWIAWVKHDTQSNSLTKYISAISTGHLIFDWLETVSRLETFITFVWLLSPWDFLCTKCSDIYIHVLKIQMIWQLRWFCVTVGLVEYRCTQSVHFPHHY